MEVTTTSRSAEGTDCESLDFSDPTHLRGVLEAEWTEIATRRKVVGRPDSDEGARPRNLAGLALSGGGIRSATFCLGLLQGLGTTGLLDRFDYLSTVSGGGFIGGWWSAWLARVGTTLFPPQERIAPELELDEFRRMGTQTDAGAGARESEGSVHAGRDPIHHLRLFANYLTPRRGFLSADTWLAAAVLSRNLILTWLILVPLLVAVVWLGQLYFVVHPASRDHFADQLFGLDAATPLGPAINSPCSCSGPTTATGEAEPSPGCVLRCRASAIVTVLGPLLFLMGLLTAFWMIWSRDRWTPSDAFLVLSSEAAAIALIFLAAKLAMGPQRAGQLDPRRVTAAVVCVALLLLLYARRRPHSAADAHDHRFLRARQRNRIVRLHAAVLVATTLAAGVLVLAGFGHDLVDYVLFSARPGGTLGGLVARSGGWAVVGLALVGMIYTAFASAPTGGGETSRAGPTLKQELILSVTPPLVVTVLGVLAAWTGHWLIGEMLEDEGVGLSSLMIASAIGVVLFICLAIYEFHPPRQWQSVLLGLVAIAALIGAVVAIHEYSLADELAMHRTGTLALMVVAGDLLLFRALVIDDWKANPLVRRLRVRFIRPELGRTGRALGILAGAIAALSGLGLWVVLALFPSPWWFDEGRALGLLAGFIVCIAISLFELRWGRGDNPRSIGLLAGAYGVLVAIAVAGFWPEWQSLQAVVGLIGSVLAWVLAFGWLADPNALSLHSFYQARLVRAYLGASNEQRTQKEISESALGDDVRLADLKNCDRGGPYHLVNTTLNLVGGRDLETAQRSSASFILSKLFCGCARTGYRPTELYMCGTLSLGTAVAISGAAASPNMGALSPTAARAMLMALLNVRLGYWAPTPSQPYWKAPQARLWPVYMIEELLSQTNDLQPYCYLTDGGHFDNTGLYALIERGCRNIVLADCGADPGLSFADLGDAIRRCRIDFGAKIELDLWPLTAKSPPAHFVQGTIQYSADHVEMLGWSEDERKDRSGQILIVKPILGGDEGADVYQYHRQNTDFPQQSTADQFFDEAQFESYRSVGELSADKASSAILKMLGG